MAIGERVGLLAWGASAVAGEGSGSALAAGGGGLASALAVGGGADTGGVSGCGALATAAGVTGSSGAGVGAPEHAQAPTLTEHPISKVAYARRIFLEGLSTP